MKVRFASQSGMQGAFGYVLEDNEIWVDEITRLGGAYKTVGGYTEAYGYNLRTMASRVDKHLSKVVDNTARVASVGVKVVPS